MRSTRSSPVALTVDLAFLTNDGDEWQVLLTQRTKVPDPEAWALPGDGT